MDGWMDGLPSLCLYVCVCVCVCQLRLEYLLRPLEGLCINQTQGWWTYEFCYPSHLRQFHVNNRGQTEEPIYSLGTLPPHIEAAVISRQQNMEENIVGKQPPYFHHYPHDESSGSDDVGSVDAELPIGFYESSPQQQGGSGAVAGRSLQKPRVHKSLRLNLTEVSEVTYTVTVTDTDKCTEAFSCVWRLCRCRALCVRTSVWRGGRGSFSSAPRTL